MSDNHTPETQKEGRTIAITIAIAGLLHGIFLLVAFLLFEADPNLEDIQNLDRFVKFMVEDVQDPEDEEVEEPEEDTTGKKAGGEDGKFGDPDEEIVAIVRPADLAALARIIHEVNTLARSAS